MGNNIYSFISVLNAREEDIDEESYFTVSDQRIQFRIINEDKVLLCGFTFLKSDTYPLVAVYGHAQCYDNWITVSKNDAFGVTINDVHYSMNMFLKIAATKNTAIYNWYYYIDEHDINQNGTVLLLESTLSENHP